MLSHFRKMAGDIYCNYLTAGKTIQISFIFFSWPALFTHSFSGIKNSRLKFYPV